MSTWCAVATVAPLAVVFWVNACFIYNHFFGDGPYLLDSGWYSTVLFHQGLLPRNPPVVLAPPHYFGIHVSPALSFASLLSYVFPGDRVDWYCLFQGAIYAPLAVMPALLVGRQRRLGPALLVAAASLAFALNGQVWSCMAFPHHEILIAVGLCAMLAGLANGRLGLAWIGLGIAAAAREDGGLHAAAFLVAVLASKTFPAPRRAVVTMAVTGGVLSVAALVAQRVFFEPADLFLWEYVGNPPLAHLTTAVLAHRLAVTFSEAQFVVLPFLATLVIAIVRRDARFLLGWAVEVPWLLLNFLAKQELKSSLRLYTGFPFVASIFWVGAYAGAAAPGEGAARWRRVVALLAVPSVLATLGFWSSFPVAFAKDVARSLGPVKTNATELRSFARALREDPTAYGRIYLDQGMAAWTIESARRADVLWDPRQPDDGRHDGVAFFRTGVIGGPNPQEWIARSPYTRCGRLVGAEVFFCTKPDGRLPPEFAPTSVLLSGMTPLPGSARRDGERVVVLATSIPLPAVYGPYVDLLPGRYAVTWDVRATGCSRGMRADIFANGVELATRPLVPDAINELSFDLVAPTRGLEFRAWSGECSYSVVGMQLRKSPL